MECVAYVRVSTEKQVEEGYGLDSQKRDIQEYAGKNGMLISKWYVDAGLSGMDMSKRVALQNLISDISNIDVVLVYKLDRLSRDSVDALYMIEKIFTPKNVEVVSVHDFARYETPQDKFQTHIMSAVAEYDRNTMLLRMRGGMLERVKKGYWMGGGNTPYCYRYDREQGILVPIPEKATKARMALNLYIEGYSDRKIANELNFKSDLVVTSILTGDVNIGLIPYKGNLYQGLHEPIFDFELFQKAKEIRQERRKKHFRVSKSYSLSGLCRCGVCGCAMRYMKWNGKQVKILCHSRFNDKTNLPYYNHDCDNEIFEASDIEELVFKEIRKISLNINNIKETKTEDLEELLKNQIESIKNKNKRLYNLYSEGNDTVVEVIKENEAEIEKLQVKLQEFQNKNNKSNKKDKKTFHKQIKHISDVWNDVDNETKNKFLKSIIKNIIIRPESIEIKLKYFN